MKFQRYKVTGLCFFLGSAGAAFHFKSDAAEGTAPQGRQEAVDPNRGESTKEGKSKDEEDGQTSPGLKTRGKLVQDASTGHWTLKVEEMEQYLDRHGRDARTFTMAFVMTGDPRYLDKATEADPGSPMGIAMKALNYPEQIEENDVERLIASLGDNRVYAQLIGLFVLIKNKNVDESFFAQPVDWSKIKEDPLSRLGDEEIKILRELGGFSLGEAIVNARKANSLGSGKAIDTVMGFYHERAKSAYSKKPEMAAGLLKQGMQLIKQRDKAWLMTGILSGVSSKGELAETAKEYGLASAFDVPFDKVLEQARTDEAHLTAMIYTLEKFVPTFDSAKVLEVYKSTEGRGQWPLVLGLMQLDDVSAFFGKSLSEVQKLPRFNQ